MEYAACFEASRRTGHGLDITERNKGLTIKVFGRQVLHGCHEHVSCEVLLSVGMRMWLAISAVVLCTFVFLTYYGVTEFPSRNTQTLADSLYIWNRAWNEPVLEGIEESTSQTSGYVVLAAQLDWEADKFNVTEVNCDYASLKQSGKAVGVAIRVGTGSRSATGGATVAKRGETGTLDDDFDSVELREPLEVLGIVPIHHTEVVAF